MDRAPDFFRNIRSREDARQAIGGVRELFTTATKFPSFLRSLPNNYLSYMNNLANMDPKKRSSVSAKLIMDTLRDAAPAVAQAYVLSERFVKAAKAAMAARAQYLDGLRYDDFLAPETKCENPDLITAYVREVKEFRTLLGASGIELSHELEMQGGRIKNTLNVGAQATELRRIVERMLRKRANNLQQTSVGANHLDEVKAVMAGDWDEHFLFSFPSAERKAVGFGAIELGEGVFVLAPPEQGRHALLLSTALARDRQEGGELLTRAIEYISNPENVGKPNYKLLRRAVVEANAVLDPNNPDAGENAGFLAQRSNIDPLFFTFYIAFHILKLTVDQFYRWQRAIYVVGRAIRGKAKLEVVLQTLIDMPGITDMIGKMSQSVEMHSPPWVLNHSRIYDIVGTIGICDSFFPQTTLATPGVSWRYFFNVTQSESLIKLLVTLDAIESIDAENLEEIVQAERILYQLLLGRSSSLACTIEMNGNALNVTIEE